MIVSMIVAAAENNAIGKNNEMLWKLPNDFRYFKNMTWGLPVIMGRKTLESLGKPLNGRLNIVLTRKGDWRADGVVVANTLEEAFAKAAEANCKEIFVIGGAEIYNQAISKADKILLTRVKANFDDADAYFPEMDPEEWKLVSSLPFKADEKHKYDYEFEVFEKVKSEKFRVESEN